MSSNAEVIESADEPTTALEALEGGAAIDAVDAAAISQQIATAKRYPRSVTKALTDAQTLATLDEETAASCFYALPRSGKTIEGPSARLAEIMAYCWGNLRADSDIVAQDRTHVTAMGTCLDLEKNVAIRVRVKRRITDRKGRRFNEDMIGVTSNAAISIALRNAVFKVIPAAFTRQILHAARRASIGQGGTMTQKRQAALDWFGKLGVRPEQVFELLQVRGLDDIGEDELITLRGLRTAIKDGDTTVEQVFTPPRHSEGTAQLNEALKGTEAPDENDAEKLSRDDPRNTASHADNFASLCDANGIDLTQARKFLAEWLQLPSARNVKAEHYEKATLDERTFVAAFREANAQGELV